MRSPVLDVVPVIGVIGSKSGCFFIRGGGGGGDRRSTVGADLAQALGGDLTAWCGDWP